MSEGKQNYIICKYKINNSDNVRIFGDIFVTNNKNICKLIYKEKQQDLIAVFNTKDIKDDILEIKITGINNIINASYMFYNAISLISLENIDNWNTSQINDMNNLLYGCRTLESLPDISKWETSKVTDMSYLFYNCSSLTSLPDI